MKSIFQILIILVMQCVLDNSIATHNIVLNDGKIEVKKIYHSCSTAGLAVQVLDNDDISPELRSRIQLAAFALSLPQIGISIYDAVTTARNLRTQHPNDYHAVQEGLALRREVARRDLEGHPEAWEFVRTHPRGADAWELLLEIANTYRKDKNILQKLANDLHLHPDLEPFLRNNSDYFLTWNSIRNLNTSRGNPITIQKFKEQLDDYAVYNNPATSYINKRNTFKGHADGYANAAGGKGGHFIHDVGPISGQGKIIIVDETLPKSLDNPPFTATEVNVNHLPFNNDGVALVTGNHRVYIAQYVLDNNQNSTGVISRYRPKSTGTEHTFFPNNISWDDIMEQFSSAQANPIKIEWDGASSLQAVSENGMTFRWYTEPSSKSIFLKY